MKKIAVFLFAILVFAFPLSALSSLEVPAVEADGTGILSTISVTATAGDGDIFVSITPLTGIDTQHSERVAVEVAANRAKINKDNYNMLFKIESSAEVVDGPSAGGALALLAYAEFSGKRMREDITITGTIDVDGRIGKIGGVFEKARAVAESETPTYKVFLVPRGQRTQNGIDLNKYAMEKWGLQVAEVETIDEAINFAFNTSEGTEVTIKERVLPSLNLIPFKPGDEAFAFRDITANEISETEKRLKHSGLREDLLVQVEEMLNLSRTLLARNYFYSGANTAFLATITLDELGLANASRRDVRSKLGELKEFADGINFTNQTEGNFEWVIGGKLRYNWAKERLENAEDKIGIGAFSTAAEDLALANSWLRAANSLNEVAKKKASGRQMKDYYYREYALEKIEEAKALDEDGLLDEEAKDHLRTAIREFEEAEYLSAAFDAGFAIGYSEALDEIGDLGYGDVVKMLCDAESFEVTCKVFRERQFDSLWSELYFAHAVYNFQESNRTRDSLSLINGMKLLKLSSHFSDVRKEALAILSNPPQPSATPTATATPKREMKVELVAVQENYQRDLVTFSIAALVVLLGAYFYMVSRRQDAPSLQQMKGKVERAEELLLEGKISERSFEYFKSKYGKDGHRRSEAKKRIGK